MGTVAVALLSRRGMQGQLSNASSCVWPGELLSVCLVVVAPWCCALPRPRALTSVSVPRQGDVAATVMPCSKQPGPREARPLSAAWPHLGEAPATVPQKRRRSGYHGPRRLALVAVPFHGQINSRQNVNCNPCLPDTVRICRSCTFWPNILNDTQLCTSICICTALILSHYKK